MNNIKTIQVPNIDTSVNLLFFGKANEELS
jgi:hypothetical protein